DLCGAAICRMFNQLIAGESLPQHLSSDHDPLFQFHRWLANLRILEVEEIKFDAARPGVPSVCGTADRDDTTGVARPRTDLERRRAGAKAGGVQDLLQRPSRSPVAQWQHPERTIWPTAALPCRPCPLRVAAPLWRSVPDADRGIITNSPYTRLRLRCRAM